MLTDSTDHCRLELDDASQLLLWGAAEIGTTIIGACIPVLRALISDAKTGPGRRREYGFNSWSAPSFWNRFGAEGDLHNSRDSQQTGLRTLKRSPPELGAAEEDLRDKLDDTFANVNSHENDGKNTLPSR